MKIEKLIFNYLNYLKITALSNQYYLYEKKELSDFLVFSINNNIIDSNEIDKELILKYYSYLKNKLIPNGNKTCNKKVASLRRACAYNELDVPGFVKLKKLKEEEKHFLFLTDEQLKKLLLYIKKLRTNCPQNLNEKLVLLILLDTGVRASELLDIRVSNVNIKDRSIKLKHTKSHRERYVFFSEYTKRILKLYLEMINKDQEFLFFNFRDNNKFSYKSLTTIIHNAEEKTDLKFSAHVLRHSNATMLANAGIDLNSLKNILGHKNIKTTEIYIHKSTKRLKGNYDKAIQKSILKQ